MKITKESEQDILTGAIIGGFSGWITLILLVSFVQYYLDSSSFEIYTLETTISRIFGLSSDPPTLKYSSFLLDGAIIGGILGGALGGYQYDGKRIYSQRLMDSFYFSIPLTILGMALILNILNESRFNVALFLVAEVVFFAYLVQFVAANIVQGLHKAGKSMQKKSE
ncbi:MAG: hypothetical protein ACFFCQ_02030 [Promethearchaeota archaeon]